LKTEILSEKGKIGEIFHVCSEIGGKSERGGNASLPLGDGCPCQQHRPSQNRNLLLDCYKIQ